jgi:hypothetical protein
MKNLSREFATMTDEERRRFALEQGETAAGDGDESAADEVVMDDPRDEDMGRHYPSLHDETADPDARDGDAAELDDAAHARAVKQAQAPAPRAKRQGKRRGQGR